MEFPRSRYVPVRDNFAVFCVFGVSKNNSFTTTRSDAEGYRVMMYQAVSPRAASASPVSWDWRECDALAYIGLGRKEPTLL
jgi:hypothetical protein